MINDYFIAELFCSKCATSSRTNIQTRIQFLPDSLDLKVGDVLELTDELDYEFILLKPPEDPDSFTLLEIWICPSCAYSSNCALIEIKDSKIIKIEAVILTEELRGQANYMCEYL